MSTQPTSGGLAAFERLINAWVAWLARHWLAIFIVGLGIFIALPLAAPLLAMRGYHSVSDVIYTVYRVTCHQLPQRSWFVAGEALRYDWPTVRAFLGIDPSAHWITAAHQPIRDPHLGYQIAFCQRDTAIWGALFLSALGYAALRNRITIRPLPLKWYLLALVPIAVDGLSQLPGWRESTPLLRTLTGGLMGVATAWLILPQLDLGFREILAYPEHAAGGEPASVLPRGGTQAGLAEDDAERDR